MAPCNFTSMRSTTSSYSISRRVTPSSNRSCLRARRFSSVSSGVRFLIASASKCAPSVPIVLLPMEKRFRYFDRGMYWHMTLICGTPKSHLVKSRSIRGQGEGSRVVNVIEMLHNSVRLQSKSTWCLPLISSEFLSQSLTVDSNPTTGYPIPRCRMRKGGFSTCGPRHVVP